MNSIRNIKNRKSTDANKTIWKVRELLKSGRAEALDGFLLEVYARWAFRNFCLK